MFYACFSPAVPVGTAPKHRATRTLHRYAESRGYGLAAAFGVSPYATRYDYVRPDFRESAEIVAGVRALESSWFLAGQRCIDYAALVPPGTLH
jgi:hypothetical protein